MKRFIPVAKVVIWSLVAGLVFASLKIRDPFSTWHGWVLTMTPILLWAIDWEK